MSAASSGGTTRGPSRVPSLAEGGLSRALDAAAVGVAIVDLDERLVDVNRSFQRVMGWSRDHLLGRRVAEITHPDDGDATRRLFRELLEGDEPSTVIEKRYVRGDGRVLWGRVSVFLARSEEGRPHYFVGLVEDVSEWKRIELEISRGRRDFAELVNSLDGIVWEADPDTIRFSFVSGQAEDILGYPPERWIEDPDFWADHIHPDDRVWVVPRCVTASRERQDHELEYRMVAADGRVVWLRDHVRVVALADGREILRGVMVDVTERREAEEAVREREAQYRSLFEGAPVGILRSTPEGRVLDGNPALVRILGYSDLEELREVDLARDVYVEADERQRIARAMGGDVYHRDEATWKRRDGELISVRMRTRVVRGDDGEPVAYETFVEDITEQRKLEERLVRSQKMEAVGRLAGGVAHDFNNILTAILGESDHLLALLPANDEASRAAAVEIQDAARRAADLTGQLLAFSRRQVLQPRVIRLNALVRDTERMLSRLLEENIEIETVLADDLWSVRIDPGQIEQVLINLAVNAGDAMPAGGRVEVRTSNVRVREDGGEGEGLEMEPGPYVRLAVSDTGVGMDEATQAQIFDPFFTTKEGPRGTGLGLATVYGVVRQSGGRIRVVSEVGQGTTFEVYLPAVEEAPEDDPVREEAGTGLPRGRETLLLVEDEDDVRRVIVGALTRFGYEVLAAADGEGALEAARSHEGPIDLLVSDVVLPGIDGLVVAERLREERPEVRLLFISGYAYEVTLDHPIVEEAGYLPKPFLPDTLAEKIREVLDG